MKPKPTRGSLGSPSNKEPFLSPRLECPVIRRGISTSPLPRGVHAISILPLGYSGANAFGVARRFFCVCLPVLTFAKISFRRRGRFSNVLLTVTYVTILFVLSRGFSVSLFLYRCFFDVVSQLLLCVPCILIAYRSLDTL